MTTLKSVKQKRGALSFPYAGPCVLYIPLFIRSWLLITVPFASESRMPYNLLPQNTTPMQMKWPKKNRYCIYLFVSNSDLLRRLYWFGARLGPTVRATMRWQYQDNCMYLTSGWFKKNKMYFDKSSFYISLLSKQLFLQRMSVSVLYTMVPFFSSDMPYFHEQKSAPQKMVNILGLSFLRMLDSLCRRKTSLFKISATYCVIFVISHSCRR